MELLSAGRQGQLSSPPWSVSEEQLGPVVPPHSSHGLDPSVDSCTLPSSLPFLCGSLSTASVARPGLPSTLEGVLPIPRLCLAEPLDLQGSETQQKSR